jgi:DNA-binding transcriptional ArsR family regulator
MVMKGTGEPRSKYLAIIGDVVRSRELQDRGEFQQRLRGSLSMVNDAFSPFIASNFMLTIGDEFQGLLNSAEKVPQILALIRSEIHPIEQRVGIGIGGLDTTLEPTAIGMDGPCFHRARDAIERAKVAQTSIEVGTRDFDDAFRIYALLYSSIRSQWTARQRQVFDLSMMGITGKEVAERLGVSPSAVSQHLSAAGANAVFDATRIWVEILIRRYESAE